ncbi:hypothetical protein L1987_77021 [Smallanthus sonchifolius]|uniref:Uncharacterized protein n=1 Tax=Smallanthus sonchifolius TaxID=185202 RepID=A0ACB8Z913_9ASTR|nr:hypothetical protein L1987_77021 [Smallanthus sonchifolius]
MIKDRTATGPPSTSSPSSLFLGCFGYSGEKIDEVNSSSRRRHRISEWSFSCKKSTTNIVDHSTGHRKSKSVNDAPAMSDTTWEIQVVEEDATLTKKHVIMVDEKHVPATSEEQKTCRKKWTDIVKRQNGPFRSRRKDMKPDATSATVAGVESPEKKTVTIPHPFVSTPLKPLTQSKSIPGPKRQKLPKATTAGGGVDKGVVHKTTPLGGEFDSIIAMSILLAIMVIMVLWGKLCAIFCTCAWFIVAPRLVAVGERSSTATAERRPQELENKLNLESVEYKKKVVLEGLLQRNHRNVVGRL